MTMAIKHEQSAAGKKSQAYPSLPAQQAVLQSSMLSA